MARLQLLEPPPCLLVPVAGKSEVEALIGVEHTGGPGGPAGASGANGASGALLLPLVGSGVRIQHCPSIPDLTPFKTVTTRRNQKTRTI